ncbi:hypothetical protein GF406_13950 [candidate division KSB1 bacterium]|nr:hypothetical protein [candidate division KSB1 bacterium]
MRPGFLPGATPGPGHPCPGNSKRGTDDEPLHGQLPEAWIGMKSTSRDFRSPDWKSGSSGSPWEESQGHH